MYPAVVLSCACLATALTFQLRVSANKKLLPVEVVDLSRFASEALGHELPDPHPEVKRQWALFPEAMMRFFGKLLLALSMMKPLFPVLIPILLPEMMPKVMWNRLLPSR